MKNTYRMVETDYKTKLSTAFNYAEFATNNHYVVTIATEENVIYLPIRQTF